MSALSEIIESAFCDRVFKGDPDFLASLYRLRDPGSPLDKSVRILASYVRRSSGTDDLRGSIRRYDYRDLEEDQYGEWPDGCELRVLVRRSPQSSDATLHGLGDVNCLVVNVYAYGRSVEDSDDGHYMYMLSRLSGGSVDFESEVYTLLSSAWLLLPKTVGYDWPMERAARMAAALESRGYVPCDYDLSDM